MQAPLGNATLPIIAQWFLNHFSVDNQNFSKYHKNMQTRMSKGKKNKWKDLLRVESDDWNARSPCSSKIKNQSHDRSKVTKQLNNRLCMKLIEFDYKITSIFVLKYIAKNRQVHYENCTVRDRRFVNNCEGTNPMSRITLHRWDVNKVKKIGTTRKKSDWIFLRIVFSFWLP